LPCHARPPAIQGSSRSIGDQDSSCYNGPSTRRPPALRSLAALSSRTL
jgi:hypothetical protein